MRQKDAMTQSASTAKEYERFPELAMEADHEA
jgi:hypothetical protein